MTDTSTSKPAPASPAPPAAGGGTVRLIVLIGILALAVGAWYYDYSVASPGSDGKYKAVLEMVDVKNAKGVKMAAW